ncbi:Uncharacterised protein [Mycobacteroides abscessus subsp. massiliense]|uniref:hypothetical protein n=2 Tax=Mycobacteroides abscessus TaxID=36809 RepID=UPI0005E9A7DD|nr:hypothetical protein [Mycobacteroides abscessus]MBN7316334.1 hypothetical protein [Mycobacteroides abscessus subsp. massiliense]CPU40998.1 Hypothetical protein ERS075557_02193 [Mycobacteroides abscessus]CPX60216.1 Hypothetical protein ERS075608_03931 [Mycobacteroides abscessus]CPZ30736.1 Hypothetical protein ERS075649_00131 [Mycobacteroides abscessus]SKE07007.1 Uncharacterised protein [Mycobacteroides abscessus subsp. massiliense]
MRISSLAMLAAAALTVAGCTGSPTDGPANRTTDRVTTASPRTTATVSNPDFVFAGPLDDYGQTLSPEDHDRALVNRAVRRIDPCGFIDLQKLGSQVPDIRFFTYRYNFDHCVLASSSSLSPRNSAVSLSFTTNISPLPLEGFDVDGIRVSENTHSASCNYYMSLGLDQLAGAPLTPSVRGITASLVLLISTDKAADPTCAAAKSVATVAAQVRSQGLPNRATESTPGIPLADRDPCSLRSKIPGYSNYRVSVPPNAHGCTFVNDTRPDDTIGVIFVPVTLSDSRFQAKTEEIDGVTVHMGDGLDSCVARVAIDDSYQPAYLPSVQPDSADLQSAATEVRGKNCDANKHVAAAVAKSLA